MAGILDSLSGLLTPEVTGKVSEMLGVDQQVFDKGIGAAIPTVLASLSKSASSPEGAQGLLNKLPAEAGDLVSNLTSGAGDAGGGNFLGKLLGAFTGGGAEGAAGGGGTKADMMSSLLGDGANAIGGTLSQKLGFNVRPILTMAVPLVAGFIAKFVKDKNLNPASLSSELKAETDQYLNNPANRETAGIISSALEAGDQAAALRKTFSDDEWLRVRLAPVASLYLVATSSGSNTPAEVQELAAAVEAVGESVNKASPTSLIGTAFGGGLTKAEIDKLHEDAPPREQLLTGIRAGLAAVSQKSPSDAQPYRDMVVNVAQRAAEAAKEGGFLGIGGTLVSAEEQQAIEEIKAALA